MGILHSRKNDWTETLPFCKERHLLHSLYKSRVRTNGIRNYNKSCRFTPLLFPFFLSPFQPFESIYQPRRSDLDHKWLPLHPQPPGWDGISLILLQSQSSGILLIRDFICPIKYSDPAI